MCGSLLQTASDMHICPGSRRAPLPPWSIKHHRLSRCLGAKKKRENLNKQKACLSAGFILMTVRLWDVAGGASGGKSSSGGWLASKRHLCTAKAALSQRDVPSAASLPAICSVARWEKQLCILLRDAGEQAAAPVAAVMRHEQMVK